MRQLVLDDHIIILNLRKSGLILNFVKFKGMLFDFKSMGIVIFFT